MAGLGGARSRIDPRLHYDAFAEAKPLPATEVQSPELPVTSTLFFLNFCMAIHLNVRKCAYLRLGLFRVGFCCSASSAAQHPSFTFLCMR